MSTTSLSSELKRLEIPGRVSLGEGNGDLPKLEIVTDRSQAELYLQGAHVTGFQKLGEPPLLFTSQFSRFERGQAFRGGVPIIFPWFGAREGEHSHGFARTANWQLNEATALPPGGVCLRLGLSENPAAATWPACTVNYVVTITETLRLELIVTNTSADQDFSFENCLHTYFQVGDIRKVQVKGLKGKTYLDKVDSFAAKIEKDEEMRITSETDRIFLDTPETVEILDASLGRRIRIEKTGSNSTVVWNPWIAKAQQMPDFGTEEYLQTLCVESGNVGRNRIVLPPAQSSVLAVTISSHPLSH